MQRQQESDTNMQVDEQVPVKQESTGSGAIWYRLVDMTGTFNGSISCIEMSFDSNILHFLSELQVERKYLKDVEIEHINVYAPDQDLTKGNEVNLPSLGLSSVDPRATLDKVLKYDEAGEKKQFPLIVQLPIVVQENAQMYLDLPSDSAQYEKDPEDFFQEGVILKSNFCMKRNNLMASFDAFVKSGNSTLLLRSPPMSGKTSFGQLLENHLLETRPHCRTVRVSLAASNSDENEFELFWKRMTGVTWEDWRKECSHIESFAIIDEAQYMFNRSLKADRFWVMVKMMLQRYNYNLTVVLLTTYGYETANACAISDQGGFCTVVSIPIEWCWGYEKLRFTREEVTEFSSIFLLKMSPGLIHSMELPILINCIVNLTSGHAGCLGFIRSSMRDHFENKKPDAMEIYNYLHSSDFRSTWIQMRCIHDYNRLSVESISQCVRIAYGNQPPYHSPEVFRLEEIGFIARDSQNNRKFPSFMILEAFFIRYNGTSIRSVIDITKETMIEFVLRVISTMSSKLLSVSRETDGRVLERAYQMEFYGAAKSCLPHQFTISPDGSWLEDNQGYVDFVIPQRKWAISLLRDGDKLEEHLARFGEKGRYRNLARDCSLNEWIVIDFRCADSSKPIVSHNNVVYVAFLDDSYRKARVLYGSNLNEIDVTLSE